MSFRFLALTLCLLGAGAVQADMTATTEDGRKVILRDNGTWSPADSTKAQTDPKALLTLEKRLDLANGCQLGLRLQNNLPAQIRTLVIRFTAYKGPEIPFETVSRGYSYIKPTNYQFQEINFRGIRCQEITSVEVFAARNCHVGELTKYSATGEDCLELFDVAPSDLMPIVKRQATM